jgi:hypothetical protein
MAPLLRSDAAALEHILAHLLEQPPVTVSDITIPPFCACLTEAVVVYASDFISMDPSEYQAIYFSAIRDGIKDTQLNVIQVKKLGELFSWFHQVTIPPITRWFDLTNAGFKGWSTRPDATFSKDVVSSPVAIPTIVSSAITDFCKGVRRSISDYTPFKEDRFQLLEPSLQDDSSKPQC